MSSKSDEFFLKLTVGAVFLLVAGVALATQLAGDTSPLWSGSLTTSGTSTCVKAASAGDAGAAAQKCALFAAGTQSTGVVGTPKNLETNTINASASGAVCCWGLTPNATISAADLEYNADDKGPCFRVPAEPGEKHSRPAFTDLVSAGAAATGICSASLSSPTDWAAGAAGDKEIYPPCSSASDCNTYHGLSSASCTAYGVASTTQLANVGAYLNCVDSGSGTPKVWPLKEKVLNF